MNRRAFMHQLTAVAGGLTLGSLGLKARALPRKTGVQL